MKICPNPTRGCVDAVSFHDPLLSKIEFRQHLPAVLEIHVPEGRLCIRRTTERCCQNSVSDRSGPWKLNSSTHPRAVQITWTIRNRYGHRYVRICIFPTVSVSNGRRLTGLRELRTEYKNRVFYTCSPTGVRWHACRCSSTIACGEVNESRTVKQPPLSTKGKIVSTKEMHTGSWKINLNELLLSNISKKQMFVEPILIL